MNSPYKKDLCGICSRWSPVLYRDLNHASAMSHWAHSTPIKRWIVDSSQKWLQCSFVRIYCSDTGHNSQQMFWSFPLCGCFSELCWKCQIYNKLLCRIWWAMLWGTLIQKSFMFAADMHSEVLKKYFVELINFSYWAINQAKVMVY